jgi:hypothetical protein
MSTELKNNDTLVRDGICKLEKVMSTIPGTILGDSVSGTGSPGIVIVYY